MPFADTFTSMPQSLLAWLTWFLILQFVLYLARVPVHRALKSTGWILYTTLRLAAVSLLKAEQRLGLRNREVLLAAGREASERIVEREFERIDEAVQRDLSEAPAVHRRLQEQITEIEEDYQKSRDVPPAPPGWIDAVEAVAKIPAKGEPMVSNILEQIHGSLVKAQDEAIDDYRGTVQERHDYLKAIAPTWRSLVQLMGVVEKKVDSMLERCKIIDRHIDDYEEILKGTDTAARRLSASSLTQFIISAFVLAIAFGGAVINFHLIARPMAEMVGGNYLIGSYKTANIAALVIILLEITMGLFLMECLRITRLFPVVGALPDKLRRLMMFFAFIFLFGLASVEAGLAYMREILVQDELATSAVLRGETAGTYELGFQWITTAAQMGMGFILPFALTFVAIPLETFVHSLRTVLGIIAAGMLRGIAIGIRVLAGASRFLGNLLVDIYDIFVIGPLWLEQQVKAYVGAERNAGRKESDATVREAT